jgi:hypothetical protein
MEELQYFFSYARQDSAFVLRLAKELRDVGIDLWLDQLDIRGGQHWDRAVEDALQTCQGMIAVLSPDALASHNIVDEVSYALEERKTIIPILLRPCTIPFRLRRVSYIDFTADYETGFSQLLGALRIAKLLPPQEQAAQDSRVFTADEAAPPLELPPNQLIRSWWAGVLFVSGALLLMYFVRGPAHETLGSMGRHIYSRELIFTGAILCIIGGLAFGTRQILDLIAAWRIMKRIRNLER